LVGAVDPHNISVRPFFEEIMGITISFRVLSRYFLEELLSFLRRCSSLPGGL
jgi:hypothetical protein